MRTSQTGIDLIKHFEGLSLTSYKDIAGIWTIGYGHTGPEVGPDQEISEDEAEDLLRKDLRRFEEGVSDLVKVDINQNQFDALVSLSYNIGLGAFGRSTALRELNKRNFDKAADAITMWNKATINGKKQVVNGLVRRRAAEKALFLEPVDASPVVESDTDSSRVKPDEEDTGRRKNLGGSRTLEGAAVAGAGGAASAGAAWMGRKDDTDAPPPDETGTGDTDSGEPSQDDAPEGNDSPADTPDDEAPPDDSETPDTAPDGEDETPSDDGETQQPDGPQDGETADDEAPGDEQPGDEETDSPADDSDQADPEEDDDTQPDDTPQDDTDTDTEAEDADSQSDTQTDEATEDDGDAAMGTEVGTPSVSEVDGGGISKAEYTEAFQIVVGIITVIAVLYIVFARIDDWINHRR